MHRMAAQAAWTNSRTGVVLAPHDLRRLELTPHDLRRLELTPQDPLGFTYTANATLGPPSCGPPPPRLAFPASKQWYFMGLDIHIGVMDSASDF